MYDVHETMYVTFNLIKEVATTTAVVVDRGNGIAVAHLNKLLPNIFRARNRTRAEGRAPSRTLNSSRDKVNNITMPLLFMSYLLLSSVSFLSGV